MMIYLTSNDEGTATIFVLYADDNWKGHSRRIYNIMVVYSRELMTYKPKWIM